MVDESAIREIERLTQAAGNQLQMQLDDTDMVIVPNGFSLQSLEGINEIRRRWRGRFDTPHLPSFAEAVAQQPNAVVYASAEGLHARAFFNLSIGGDPGQGDHTASLQLRQTPEWAAVQALDGDNLTQAELIEWLEDWGHIVTAYMTADGEVIQQPAAFAAIRDISIDTARTARNVQEDMKEQRGIMETVEVRDALKFPTRLGLNFKPAEGLADVYATVRLYVQHAGASKPNIRARLVSKDRINTDVALCFVAALREEISAPIFIGRYEVAP